MRYKIMHSKMLELCKINRFALSGALDNKIDQKNCLVNYYGIMSTTYLNSSTKCIHLQPLSINGKLEFQVQ